MVLAPEGWIWYFDHMVLTCKQEAVKTPSDPDLDLILDRWPDLPERIKAAVMALVRGEGD